MAARDHVRALLPETACKRAATLQQLLFITLVWGVHLTVMSRSPKAVPPMPPNQRGHPPSLERSSPGRPWRQIAKSG